MIFQWKMKVEKVEFCFTAQQAFWDVHLKHIHIANYAISQLLEVSNPK
jgi:hypothetical protein